MTGAALSVFLLATCLAEADAPQHVLRSGPRPRHGVAAVSNEVRATVGSRISIPRPDAAEEGRSHWVELSGPEMLLRNGERSCLDLVVRPRTPGRYSLAWLPGPGSSLADAQMCDLVVEPAADDGRTQAAQIAGPFLVGSGEDIRPEVSLAGSAGAPLAARWRQLGGPSLGLSRTELSSLSPRMRASLPGRYRFGVRLLGERGWTPEATWTFEVPIRPDGRADRRPSAWVKPLVHARQGEIVELDASRSSDPDGDELTFLWEKISGPDSPLPVPAGGAAGARFRFLPLAAGEYVFALTVADPFGLRSAPQGLVIRVGLEAVSEPGGQSPGPDDPLDRPFAARLENAPLDSLLARLSDAGVMVRLSPELAQSDAFRSLRMDLWVVDLPARKVLDWLGRALGASYVVEGNGAVWFDRGTRWLEREGVQPTSFAIDALFPAGDPSGLVAFLRESVRAALWASPGAGLGPVDAAKGILHASLPESARRRIERIIAELRREAPSGAPPAISADSRLLSRPVRVNWQGWGLRDAAWDLARQARVPIAWSPLDIPPRGSGGPGARPAVAADAAISLELGETSLRDALDALVRAAGLDGYILEPPGAVWLLKGAPPSESSECVWTSGVPRSYDVRLLEDAHGYSGATLVHLVKSRVLPSRWSDPFSAIGYVAALRRLVVVHSAEVQREVAAFLERLCRRGEKALAD